jgi:uncharacterized protein (TIGR04255 family)
LASGPFQFDPSKVFPTLPRAPIVEAVLHWQAAASVELVESSLRGKLEESFPEYEIVPQHNIETAFTGSAQGVEIKQSATREGFRLTKKEGDKPVFVCQFTRNGIVVSRLAPYKNWGEFAPEAVRFWRSFVEIAQPSEIARLSTRFISQIPIALISEVEQYIDIAEKPLSAIGIGTDRFFHQDTLKPGGRPYMINLVRAVQPGQQASTPLSLIVDIDVRTTESITDFAALPQTLKELRFIKNEVFFALMKDAENKFGDQK